MQQKMHALQRCLVSEMDFAGRALRDEGYLHVTGIVDLLVVYVADLPSLMGKTSSVIHGLEHKQDYIWCVLGGLCIEMLHC